MTSGSSFNETYYVLRDYLDPVAIVKTDGTVEERYRYESFGPVTALNASFAASSSTAAWDWLFHGEFRDAESGLYNYGYRYYHPQLGRWLSRDPKGERGGFNLFVFPAFGPVNGIDLLGLEPTIPPVEPVPYPPFAPQPVVKPVEDDPPPLSPDLDPSKFNCAGLATRTFKDMPQKEFDKFSQDNGYERNCESSCPPGSVRMEKLTFSVIVRGPSGVLPVNRPDFHVTSGQGVQDNKFSTGPIVPIDNDTIGPGTQFPIEPGYSKEITKVLIRVCYCVKLEIKYCCDL